ncbi:MAG: imidazolonepropionase [Burkholderiales bacterium]|nr:imidazolonepropionase [Burkholderiales bacterium]
MTRADDGRRLWRHARIASFDGERPWGWIDDGALLVEGARIAWIGPDSALPAALAAASPPAAEVDLGGALLTPGLIDCHTHLVYAGDRAAEFDLRLQGASYEQIARAGGGIRSTVAATRAADDARLFELAAARARALIVDGVTTVEIKSGYGLTERDEARCLAVARRIGRELPVAVRTTSLGAHALPPEYEGRADDYIDAVCRWMPAQQAAGLVDAVDAFCDTVGFGPAQTRRVFDAARALGLPVKLHAEQLSDQGGAALAASYGALSCDHLEHLSAAGIAAMKAAGTVGVLLPGAYYFLRETRLPPVAALREAGVPIALATDHNPGSSPCLSLVLMLNMGCTLFRLTPEQAWCGVTVEAARALALADRGRLAAGLRADFAVWDAEHPRELCYRFGHAPCRQRVFGGVADNPVLRR